MKKILLVTGIIFVLGLIILFPGKKLAREHVNLKTAVTDHPLLCTNCHLHMHKRSPFARFDHLDYYSPLNLAVSNDGKLIYVAAQDGNALLVADAGKGTVIQKIAVGSKPHSVILDKAGKNAYVSNQWSDNVSVVDLENFKITDTLSTGNGPAGLSLSFDEKFLYVVNSYSSDLTVIDLESGMRLKGLQWEIIPPEPLYLPMAVISSSQAGGQILPSTENLLSVS